MLLAVRAEVMRNSLEVHANRFGWRTNPFYLEARARAIEGEFGLIDERWSSGFSLGSLTVVVANARSHTLAIVIWWRRGARLRFRRARTVQSEQVATSASGLPATTTAKRTRLKPEPQRANGAASSGRRCRSPRP